MKVCGIISEGKNFMVLFHHFSNYLKFFFLIKISFVIFRLYYGRILLHCDSEIIKSKIVNFCTELYEKDHHGDHSVHLFAFLADNAVETVENKTENSKENIKFALKVFVFISFN